MQPVLQQRTDLFERIALRRLDAGQRLMNPIQAQGLGQRRKLVQLGPGQQQIDETVLLDGVRHGGTETDGGLELLDLAGFRLGPAFRHAGIQDERRVVVEIVVVLLGGRRRPGGPRRGRRSSAANRRTRTGGCRYTPASPPPVRRAAGCWCSHAGSHIAEGPAARRRPAARAASPGLLRQDADAKQVEGETRFADRQAESGGSRGVSGRIVMATSVDLARPQATDHRGIPHLLDRARAERENAPTGCRPAEGRRS